MRLSSIAFKPKGYIQFSPEEIALLLECSEKHYDSVCKEAGRVGGFLYGLKNWMENVKESTAHDLTFREIDTLAKISEIGHYFQDPAKKELAYKLNAGFSRILRQLNQATPAPVEFPESSTPLNDKS